MSPDRSTHSASHFASPRISALVLAMLFLLQSAAQAGSGCMARVFAGRCCCESTDSGTTPHVARRACCEAPVEHAPSAPTGPNIGAPSGCHCQLAPSPNAPADNGVSQAIDRSRSTNHADASAGFALWIASAATVFVRIVIEPPLILGPPGSPPRTDSTFAATRLAHRGVIGLLSELCTVRL